MSERDMKSDNNVVTPQDDREPCATATLKLKADSGYESEETHRVSADQWGRICAILHGADVRANVQPLLELIRESRESLASAPHVGRPKVVHRHGCAATRWGRKKGPCNCGGAALEETSDES